MLTGATDSAPGTLFSQASEKSGFGQVFQNNMDKNSFSGDIRKQIEFMLSNSQHALFYSQAIRNSEAYKYCQVDNFCNL